MAHQIKLRILFSPIFFSWKRNQISYWSKRNFVLSWKNQNKHYVILAKKICENKISRFVVWSDQPIAYFKFKTFVNRMSKLAIMSELVGLLTLVWTVNFVIKEKRFFAWKETWKQPLVNFCMAGSRLIMENIHMEVDVTKVVVIYV